MHEYTGGNLALRRMIAEVNSARPNAPVVDGPPGRRRSDRARLRATLAGALRRTAAWLDPPCATTQTVSLAVAGPRGEQRERY
ncbi:hypothetical protein ACFS27_20105 [Promicromonospora vindobonensis]|uniref:Uncharacterized protein n=1 Tax=Promicromonospora vindobonensis TaxID=195748 RepID=A0ABW5VY04_9MICO